MNDAAKRALGFGALAIDVGHLYNVKNQLQAAADAAAARGPSSPLPMADGTPALSRIRRRRGRQGEKGERGRKGAAARGASSLTAPG